MVSQYLKPQIRLFTVQDLGNVLSGKRQAIVAEINSYDSNYIDNSNENHLLSYLEEKYALEVPSLDESSISASQEDKKIQVKDIFTNRVVMVDGNEITFYVPYSGEKELFKYQPSTYSSNFPCASNLTDNELHFVFEVRATEQPETIRNDFDLNLNSIKRYLQWVGTDVAQFNIEIRSIALDRLNQRRAKFVNDRKVVEGLGVPIRVREDAPSTYSVPSVRKKVPIKPVTTSLQSESEPILDMENYDHILSVISNMAIVLERSPKAFKSMGEEDLRQHFLVQLNGQYEGQSTGETFNMSGKTDILIRIKDKNIFIAECKFWKGPSVFTETLDQLLGYLTWRDTKAAIIIFNRGTRLTTVLEKIPELVRNHQNFKSELSYSSETGFRYLLTHNDDSYREILVTVLVFEVPD